MSDSELEGLAVLRFRSLGFRAPPAQVSASTSHPKLESLYPYMVPPWDPCNFLTITISVPWTPGFLPCKTPNIRLFNPSARPFMEASACLRYMSDLLGLRRESGNIVYLDV